MPGNQKFQFRQLRLFNECTLAAAAAVAGYQYITVFPLKQDTQAVFIVICPGIAWEKCHLSTIRMQLFYFGNQMNFLRVY